MSELTLIPGVGNVTAEKLEQAGVDNVDAVAAAAVELLVQLTGFYEGRAAKIQQAAQELTRGSAPEARPLTLVAPAAPNLEAEAIAKKPKKAKKPKRSEEAKKLERLAASLKKASKKAKKAGKSKKARKAKTASKKAAKKAKKLRKGK